MGFLEEAEDEGDSFLEDTDSGGDGFLDDVDEEPEGFLDNIDDKNTTERPPHPYNVSNHELITEWWQDDWHDATETVTYIGSGMIQGECQGCGYGFCVSEKNRTFHCTRCDTYNFNLEWEDDRIDTEDRPEWDSTNL